MYHMLYEGQLRQPRCKYHSRWWEIRSLLRRAFVEFVKGSYARDVFHVSRYPDTSCESHFLVCHDVMALLALGIVLPPV